MKTFILQIATDPRSPEGNIRAAEAMIAARPDGDLYVLSEMWATGFTVRPNAAVHETGEKALRWMRDAARRYDCAVAGSLAVFAPSLLSNDEEGSKSFWRNRFFFVTPDGETCYDKRHLFVPAGENRVFMPGRLDAVADWRGVRVKLQTCFDLRFPQSAARTETNDYDLLLYTAAWPAARREAWDVLLRARAIENQSYVIGVNHTGRQGGTLYNGGSTAVAPDGKVLVRLQEVAGIAEVEVNPEECIQLRRAFPLNP